MANKVICFLPAILKQAFDKLKNYKINSVTGFETEFGKNKNHNFIHEEIKTVHLTFSIKGLLARMILFSGF